MENKSLIFGILIIILGVLDFPPIAEIIFGDYVCGHYNMYLVSIAIILIGIFLIWFFKKKYRGTKRGIDFLNFSKRENSEIGFALYSLYYGYFWIPVSLFGLAWGSPSL